MMPEYRSHRKLIRDALADSNLQIALRRAVRAYISSREEALRDFDFEAARNRLREVKERCIDNMGLLFERFRQEAENVGVVVHQARNGLDVAEIVASLAHSRGAQLLVKSKSMLTEEIRLNDNLQARGLRVVETDLGEWIVQLAGERPSHFTMPAMHKTREQVAELFSRVNGEQVEPDVPKLVRVARKKLRQCFIDADMGISGANVAIANTGTLVIVSNEGNARLVTTLPPIHVALVGYEKLVESLEDATCVLDLLSRCATGQKQTAYVSFITGPSRTTDIEKTLTLGVHGPEEVHIIFVDAGRRAMASDSELREALYCIKCGACLNLCPVYNSVGGHVYSNSNAYMGGIGTVLNACRDGLGAVEATLDLCSGCGTCVSACPVMIDIPRMILELRRRLAAERGISIPVRIGMSVMRRPRTFRSTVRLVRFAQTGLIRSDKASYGLRLISDLLGGRRLTDLADKFLRESLPGEQNHEGKPRVVLFAGCMIDFVYPMIGEAISTVLTRLGAAVLFPQEQSCCGAPAMYLGDFYTAQKLAQDTVDALKDCSADYITTGCPTCAVMLKYRLPEFLRDTLGYKDAVQLSERVVDFSQLVSVLVPNLGSLVGKEPFKSVTYHAPCHQKHILGTSSFSVNILKNSGFNLVEAPFIEGCCGFAGTYNFKQPAISTAILERKLESILTTGVELVATDCPGCIMQIGGGLRDCRSLVKVLHTAELLAELIG
ncbi:MAG: LUD domain-containing protein [Armatimonadota bacterium]